MTEDCEAMPQNFEWEKCLLSQGFLQVQNEILRYSLTHKNSGIKASHGSSWSKYFTTKSTQSNYEFKEKTKTKK